MVLSCPMRIVVVAMSVVVDRWCSCKTGDHQVVADIRYDLIGHWGPRQSPMRMVVVAMSVVVAVDRCSRNRKTGVVADIRYDPECYEEF